MKSFLKRIYEGAEGGDGFKGMMFLEKRFDAKTAASLLQAHLEVVTPQGLKGSDLVAGIPKWEMKANQLHSRYNQSLDDNLKLAILVGMLPKEFQDLVFQNGTGEKDLKYIDSRAFVFRIAHQRAQMARPVLMDVGQVWGRRTRWISTSKP